MGVVTRALGLVVAMLGAGSAVGCAGAQASCNQSSGGAGQCQEYSGAPAAALDTFMAVCGSASGTWSTSGCARTGAIGECRQQEVTATITTVFYSGTVEVLRSNCTGRGGSWSGP